MDNKKSEGYKDYFMNRTVEDIMEEHSDHRDEWRTPTLKEKTAKTNNSDK